MYLYLQNSDSFSKVENNHNVIIRKIIPPFKGLHSITWHILSKLCNTKDGFFVEYQAILDGKVVSKAQVVSWIPIFPFMPHNGIHIGPCETLVSERGKGFYPLILQHIIESHPNKQFYMIIDENNQASLRGVRKVGFTVFAKGYKKKWRYVKIHI